MKKYFSYITIIFFLLVGNVAVNAQNATATIDSANILIGDHFHIQLKAVVPATHLVIPPVFLDSISKNIEIVEASKLDSLYSTDKKLLTLTQTITATSFDSGAWTIPPFQFLHKAPQDTAMEAFFSNALQINVNTVAVDTTQAIKDIKEPLKAPITFKEILPWLLGGLIVLAIIFAGIYFYRRYKNKKPLFTLPEKPAIPAHQWALEELEKLRLKKLWQSNFIKEYYTELTDILRLYFEKRFAFDAMEMTSDEIIAEFKKQKDYSSLIAKLEKVLTTSDLVKFAKGMPVASEHDSCFLHAKEIIENTIPKVVTTMASPLETAINNNNAEEIIRNNNLKI